MNDQDDRGKRGEAGLRLGGTSGTPGGSGERGRVKTSSMPAPPIEPVAANPVTESLAPGTQFGAYVVGPCIGQGGMARIYRAEHEGLQRPVALKVMMEGCVTEEWRERFLREARNAAAIKHPNVVNIFDVGVVSDIPFMAMELLEGEDLETLLESKGSLEESAIIDIMVPVVAGLAAVHDAGVVHRDLKPGNVFLARGRHGDIEPKLLDFGISKSSTSKQLKLTDNNNRRMMGTPFYMPPEAVQGREMTAQSDQYSLGVLIYECATGVNPFLSDSLAEVVQRIATGNYVPVAERATHISRRLTRIIERSMSLDPSERYADARELGRELLVLAGARTQITWGMTFGAPGASRAPTRALGSGPLLEDEPPPPPNRRGGWWIAAAALLAVVFVGGYAWLDDGDGGEPTAADATTTTEASETAVDVTRSALQPLETEAAGDEADTAGESGGETPDEAATALDADEPEPAEAEEAPAPPPKVQARPRPAPVRKRRAKRKVRTIRQAQPVAARPAPASEAPETDATPAWAINAPRRDRGRFIKGTNNAPILD